MNESQPQLTVALARQKVAEAQKQINDILARLRQEVAMPIELHVHETDVYPDVKIHHVSLRAKVLP